MRPQKHVVRGRIVTARWREAGATSIEYALMIIMVAFVILFATAILGGKTFSWFDNAATLL
jgi:Flp pilus assembly pilin Flp